jgi:hypothetical protein
MLNGDFGNYKIRDVNQQNLQPQVQQTIREKTKREYKRFEGGASVSKAKSQTAVKETKVKNKNPKGWGRMKDEELGSDSDQGVD